mgnify:CR=1 FL=1
MKNNGCTAETHEGKLFLSLHFFDKNTKYIDVFAKMFPIYQNLFMFLQKIGC